MSVICLQRKTRCRGRLFVATFVAAIILQVVHGRKYTSQELRKLQEKEYLVDEGPPITCSFGGTTFQGEAGFTQGEGIVFAMKSKDSDDNGVKITSFGFHVPAATSQNVDFQVYALKQDGYYADPNRGIYNEGSGYDYRGISQLDKWEMISSGTIRKADLIESATYLSANEPDFYKIPPRMFAATEIPPNGGIRSFYVSTTLIYTDPMLGREINDEQLLVGFNDPVAPELLVGEGASGFSDTKIFYKTQQFVGKFFYETECATEAPSLSLSPSTSKPTSSPSLSPTTSNIPTKSPTPPVQPAGAEAALSFPLPKCDPKQVTVPQEVQDAVSEQVKETVTNGEDAEDFENFETTVVDAKVRCDKRRMTKDDSQHNRLLQTRSSAMEFSLVITGEYRSTDGKPPDLGSVVEDSINADAAKFTKDLKARSASPLLQQAMEPKVEARTLDEDELVEFKEEPDAFEVAVIAISSPSPSTEQSSDKAKTALLIVILIVVGVMVVLAAFLLFRHAERRAVENRREKMERISEQRVSELKEDTMKQQWEKENNMRMASKSRKQTKNQGQGDYPPYYRGAPPQHQEYAYPHTQAHYQDSFEDDEY
mmetsp:Transcript_1199/g.1639  ORF Transcript_1199/g.1639 Transcript_1199/m.1639 type:complete len:596 (-) Transcript_1199:48-1835(-)|eukprot:CAMPEP_0201697840 /NCGR_PEP_ID=MMETSP0578-20130828/14471_1 /ASSEMBLY_ACC=CAM_ASM_000663 /TAXON_ID=267565 /ORGANISM="Skeletonema grethea, Strain CCMP 1804" /LENGTH=595 /DNA_ID=CAMNT_0048184183 /DNA_START=271 /DNA_END=2058 /DNA_ORIENTATION=-